MAGREDRGDMDAPRKKAEGLRGRKGKVIPEDPATLAPEDLRRLFHELRVHQIELEMQNEELLGAQEELETARARCFDLYDLAPVGHCTVRENGSIVEGNRLAAELLGLERSALVGCSIADLISREDQDAWHLYRKRLLENRSAQTCDLRMMRKNGRNFRARLNSISMAANANKAVFRVAINDISEQLIQADILDLTLVRLLAAQLDGTLEISTEKGTTFSVRFPERVVA